MPVGLKLDKTFSLQSLLQTVILAASIFTTLVITTYKAAQVMADVQHQHRQIIDIDGKILELIISGKCK